MGPATIVLIENGRQSPLALDPADFGIKPCTEEDLAVHSKEEALNVLQEIVQGRGSQHMKDTPGRARKEPCTVHGTCQGGR